MEEVLLVARKSYPQWIMADQSDGELFPRREGVRRKCGLLFWLVEALGLLEQVDPNVFSLGGHDVTWMLESRYRKHGHAQILAWC